MTDDALASATAFQTLPTDEINYMVVGPHQ